MLLELAVALVAIVKGQAISTTSENIHDINPNIFTQHHAVTYTNLSKITVPFKGVIEYIFLPCERLQSGW